MQQFSWRTKLILFLVFVSLAFYLTNYIIFRDPQFMLRLITLQLGFVPVSVILITLFLSGLINKREKRSRLEKMNMVIGTFFTEVGTGLLDILSSSIKDREHISREIVIKESWTDHDFSIAEQQFTNTDYEMVTQPDKLEEMSHFLVDKRDFVLRLLENPNLLEHESFSDLLWAVTHLADELAHRKNLSNLRTTDLAHLANDIKRAYGTLFGQWLLYIKHLKNSYPYLFSLAVRTNPLDPNASVEVI